MPFDSTPIETDAQRNVRILREARAGLLRPNAWVQGVFSNGDGSHCALGWAMKFYGEATGWRYADCVACTHAKRLLYPALPWWWRRYEIARLDEVARFNDAPWRRKQAIVQLFDRAIRIAESKLEQPR